MKYCYKCGYQLEDDDLFCGNCGEKQMQDNSANGENFDHNKNDMKKETTEHENLSNYRRSSNVNLSYIIDNLLKMFTKPISTSKRFIEDRDNNTVIAVSIFSILFYGILGIWRIKQLFYSAENIMINGLKKIESIYRLFGNIGSSTDTSDINQAMIAINKVKQSIVIPYGKIFFQNCIVFIMLLIIIFAFISVATNITNHKQTSALETYKISLIVLIPFLYFKTLSILISYGSNYVGIGIQLIGIIVSIGCLFILIKDVLGVKEDCSLFIVSICFVVICIAYLVCLSNFIYSDLQQVITSFKGINF